MQLFPSNVRSNGSNRSKTEHKNKQFRIVEAARVRRKKIAIKKMLEKMDGHWMQH